MMNQEVSKIDQELSKLMDNISYWTLYFDYKNFYEDFYGAFFSKKAQGFLFEECFLVFSSIKKPSCEAELDAYNAVINNLRF